MITPLVPFPHGEPSSPWEAAGHIVNVKQARVWRLNVYPYYVWKWPLLTDFRGSLECASVSDKFLFAKRSTYEEIVGSN